MNPMSQHMLFTCTLIILVVFQCNTILMALWLIALSQEMNSFIVLNRYGK